MYRLNVEDKLHYLLSLTSGTSTGWAFLKLSLATKKNRKPLAKTAITPPATKHASAVSKSPYKQK